MEDGEGRTCSHAGRHQIFNDILYSAFMVYAMSRICGAATIHCSSTDFFFPFDVRSPLNEKKSSSDGTRERDGK